jgi:hypothetical protein
MRVIIVALAALTLAGCMSSGPRIERSTPDHVLIPVPVMPEVMDELKHCGDQPPKFVFRPHPEDKDLVILYAEDQFWFRHWIHQQKRCIEAWRGWADV